MCATNVSRDCKYVPMYSRSISPSNSSPVTISSSTTFGKISVEVEDTSEMEEGIGKYGVIYTMNFNLES